MISFAARQRFRQRLQHIENADEILDALNEFIERFILVSNNVSSNQYVTIYEYEPNMNETTMITYSIIGRENSIKQSGFKRTAVFYRETNLVNQIDIQQTDFSSKTDSGFNARLLADGTKIKLQVKGCSNNLTQWRGSIEVEKLGE